MAIKRRALFIDRDGVINIDYGHVYRREQFEFVEGIFDLCRKAIELDYLIFVLTNQAGIGRGYYTEQQFHELTDWMCGKFLAQGIKIEQVYFCPFHPQYGIGDYKQNSIFRKPGPGMILEAARAHELDLALSVLVGDKISDIEAGIAAGVGCNILYRPDRNEQITPTITISVNNLRDARSYLSEITQ
ncbi:MAG: HAD family hydrolase [Nitrosospira sp.]|nr:HAD family hydrolase [Nitrosospira sp.]